MLVGKCPCGKRGEGNSRCSCGGSYEVSLSDYAAALRRMMATASEDDGDTTCTVDGMNWHCIWCGEPVSGPGHEHCTFRSHGPTLGARRSLPRLRGGGVMSRTTLAGIADEHGLDLDSEDPPLSLDECIARLRSVDADEQTIARVAALWLAEVES